jgi:ribosomal protein L30/L7E
MAAHDHTQLKNAKEILVSIADLEKPYVGLKRNIGGIKLDSEGILFNAAHSLAGRATTVIRGKAEPDLQMVCKIYHPEVQRRHEGITLRVVHSIAKKKDKTMSKHLPTLYFYGDIPGCTTHRIRSMIKRNWKGHRTLRIMGLKQLNEITTVSGEEFIKAWLEVVTTYV